MTLMIYRLVPVADRADPRWLGNEPPGELVVRAQSPAQARIVAASVEDQFLAPQRFAEDGITNAYFSAFRSDKLYAVVEDETDAWPRQGEPAVLSGLTLKSG